MALGIANEFEQLFNIQKYYLTSAQFRLLSEWKEIVVALASYEFIEKLFEYVRTLSWANIENVESIESIVEKLQSLKQSTKSQTEWLVPKPNVSFDTFIGRKELIATLENSIDLIQTNEEYKMILFVGPPGVGKSVFAQACMNYYNSTNNYVINLVDVQSKYIGETENNLKSLFSTIDVGFSSSGENDYTTVDNNSSST